MKFRKSNAMKRKSSESEKLQRAKKKRRKRRQRRFFILSLKNATKSLHAYTSIWHISKQTQEGTMESRM